MHFLWKNYIAAWRRAFFKQNNTFSLSYFLYFYDDFTYPTPFWFHKWWANFEIDHKNVPEPIQLAYNNFITKRKLREEFDNSPSWLVFCHNFQVPWILMTEFHIKDETIDNYTFTVLL